MPTSTECAVENHAVGSQRKGLQALVEQHRAVFVRCLLRHLLRDLDRQAREGLGKSAGDGLRFVGSKHCGVPDFEVRSHAQQNHVLA